MLRKPEALKEQNKRSKEDSLEKIDQLENLIVTKGESRGQSTTTKTIERDTLTSTSTESKVVEDGNSNQTTQTTDESGPETPKTLSLTSDSNQKRGTLEELNQDDGTRIHIFRNYWLLLHNVFRDVCCCCCWGRSLLHHRCRWSWFHSPSPRLLSRKLLPSLWQLPNLSLSKTRVFLP